MSTHRRPALVGTFADPATRATCTADARGRHRPTASCPGCWPGAYSLSGARHKGKRVSA